MAITVHLRLRTSRWLRTGGATLQIERTSAVCVTQFHDELDTITDQLVEMTRLAGRPWPAPRPPCSTPTCTSPRRVIAADDDLDEIQTRARRPVHRPAGPAAAGRHRPAHRRHRAADERRPRADGRPGPARRQGRPAALPRLAPCRRSCGAHPRDGPDRRAASSRRPARSSPPRTSTAALELEQDDDAMDELHRQLFDASSTTTGPHGMETAVDVTLLGRYYERFADHAVSVAQPRRLPGHGRVPQRAGPAGARPRGAGGLAGRARERVQPLSGPGWPPPRRPRRPLPGRGSDRRA